MKKKFIAVLVAALLGLNTIISNLFIDNILRSDNGNTVSLLFLNDDVD